MIHKNKLDDIPDIETVEMIAKTVPPTKCTIKKGFNYYEVTK